MKHINENVLEGICKKIDELYSTERAFLNEYYKKRLVKYPTEIEQNIVEWINNVPFSEIDYHGVSIKKVYDGLELSDSYIPTLLDNFIVYKEMGFSDPMICYRGFFN